MRPEVIASPPPTPKPASSKVDSTSSEVEVPRNRYGYRVDPEIKFDKVEVYRIKKLKLCNVHYLRGDCYYDNCTHDHDYKPTKAELHTLRCIARMVPCRMGGECDDVKCIYGHRCLAGSPCVFGDKCKFSEDMHNVDTRVVKKITV